MSRRIASHTEPARSEPRYRILGCEKRIRVFLSGIAIADTRRALLFRPQAGPPHYGIPERDILHGVLESSRSRSVHPVLGGIRRWHVHSGEAMREDAAWSCTETSTGNSSLTGYVFFDWDAMDAWFEEDEEVRAHPRDPFTRIDTLSSSQPVRIEHRGMRIAESHRPVLLFETGLPVRYYLPKPDLSMNLLVPSDAKTHCPYKGEASYFSLVTGGTVVEDAFWCYEFPVAEALKIAGMVSFLPQSFDQVFIDDHLLTR